MPVKNPDNKKSLNPELASYINTIKNDFSQIPQDRKDELEKIALYIQKQVNTGQPAQLTYICTHNSRRSHFGQIWAATAAFYYDIPNVKTYSGGTEATAFNDRAVAACERAGFDIPKHQKAKIRSMQSHMQLIQSPLKLSQRNMKTMAIPRIISAL